MDEFRARLAQSYAQHPGFRFDQRTLELDPALLEAFADPYHAVRSPETQPTRGQVRRLRERCGAGLAAVFAELRNQTREPHESRFLEELQAECGRRLVEELAFYQRQRPRAHQAGRDTRTHGDMAGIWTDRYVFGALPKGVAEEILEVAAAGIPALRAAVRQGRLTRDALSQNTGAHVDAIRRILDRDFRARGVTDAVSAYTGHDFAVTGLAIELSLPQATWWHYQLDGLPRPPRTLYAHLDESVAHVKSIVYLSEVGTANGPTSCYPQVYESLRLNPLQELIGRVIANVGSREGSPLRDYYGRGHHTSMSSASFRAGSRADRARRHFMLLPAELRFNAHLGWDILPDSQFEASLTSNEQTLVGGPGTFVLFDGARLLHRGGLIQEGERIVLQVVMSDPDVSSRLGGKAASRTASSIVDRPREPSPGPSFSPEAGA